MRTVSTKLDNVDHDRLLEICNKEGKSVSEYLRDLVQECCSAFEDEEEPEQNTIHTPKPILNKTAQYKVVLYPDMPKGQDQVTKVSYDDGKTWYDQKGNLISKSKDYDEPTQQKPRQKVVINV